MDACRLPLPSRQAKGLLLWPETMAWGDGSARCLIWKCRAHRNWWLTMDDFFQAVPRPVMHCTAPRPVAPAPPIRVIGVCAFWSYWSLAHQSHKVIQALGGITVCKHAYMFDRLCASRPDKHATSWTSRRPSMFTCNINKKRYKRGIISALEHFTCILSP